MNKKTIITALLVLVTMTGQGQSVWEEPLKAYTTSPSFEVRKVELTAKRTILHVRYSSLPNYWFQIGNESYLQTNGKQYDIIGSDSIQLGSRLVLDDSGSKDFVLYFQPLPTDTKEFDFLEGLADGDFKVFGIHDKDYVIPAAPIPTDYLADYAYDDQLADMKYGNEPAMIHFKALNYRKGMRTRIKVQYVDLKNPARPVDAVCRMSDDGEAELSLPIGFPQTVWADITNIPWGSDCILYLAPGKEITVLVDMLHDDRATNSKFVGYKGYFAKFDKERYQLLVNDCLGNGYKKPTLELKDVHNVKALMNYYDEERENFTKWIEESNCSNAIKKWGFIRIFIPPYISSGELDSLAQTKEFTDYLLQHYMRNLYEKKMLLNFDFVLASKYYIMADAKGVNADLARYCYFLPQMLDGKNVEKPLIEDKSLSDLYDKYVAEYQTTVTANKQGLADNIHYLDMTDVAPEAILQTILDKYKGKTILIDIWATWCGPCILGHEKMKPLKEELSDKNIVYVYLTSPTSDYDKWKKYIADISGEHYYLTDAQKNYIMNQYEADGIPAYAIYNTKGELTYKQSGFAGIEVIREALEKALDNK